MTVDRTRSGAVTAWTNPADAESIAPAPQPSAPLTGYAALVKDGFDDSPSRPPLADFGVAPGSTPPGSDGAAIAPLTANGRPDDPSAAMNVDPGHPTQGMKAAEVSAYERLSPEEKSAYDALHRSAANGEARTEDLVSTDPTARQSNTHAMMREAVTNLRGVLASGHFSDYLSVSNALPSSSARDQLRDLVVGGRANGRLLDQLAPLAQGGVTAQGVDRQQLLGQIVQDVTRPDQMVQGLGNVDCAGTAASYLLAREQPAQYAHAVAQLAEHGTSTLATGQRLSLDGFDPSNTQRSLTQQLFAHAFVEGAGAQPAALGLSNLLGGDSAVGIHASQLQPALERLTGQRYGALYVAQGDEGTAAQRALTREEAIRVLGEQSTANKTAVANLTGAHWVVVSGVDGSGEDARVRFVDGSGAQKSLSMAQFADRLDSLVFNAAVSHPEYLGERAWGHGGIGGNAAAGTNGGND